MTRANSADAQAGRKDASRGSERAGAALGLLHVLLAPLRLLKWLFFSDLRLKRRGGKLRIVLDGAPGAAGEAAGPQPAASVDERMHRELRAMLDKHPQTRLVLKHLVAFEDALRRSGAEALQEVPVELLRRALGQLESLVNDWASFEGLVALRDRMTLALVEREKQAEGASYGAAVASDFNVQHKLEVEEVPVSAFSTQVFREMGFSREQVRAAAAAEKKG